MTENQVIQQMCEHFERKFPMFCGGCNRRFETFLEYLQNTEPHGSPIPYDAEFGDWTPARPVGTVVYADCACGHTLALSSEGMPLKQLWALLDWLRTEAPLRRTTPRELLRQLRVKVRQQYGPGALANDLSVA